LIILLFPFNALAKKQTCSKEDLLQSSNTVVKGTVVDVECTGETIEEFCGKMTGYRAKVKVESALKGEPFNNLFLNFYKYDFNRKCFGTSNMRHYKGEQAVYYLNCNASGCKFTDPSGIDYIKKGDGRLPNCTKSKKRSKR